MCALCMLCFPLKLNDELSFIITAACVFCVLLAALHRPHSTVQILSRLVAMERANQVKGVIFVGHVSSSRVTGCLICSVMVLVSFRVYKRLGWRPSIGVDL